MVAFETIVLLGIAGIYLVPILIVCANCGGKWIIKKISTLWNKRQRRKSSFSDEGGDRDWFKRGKFERLGEEDEEWKGEEELDSSIELQLKRSQNKKEGKEEEGRGKKEGVEGEEKEEEEGVKRGEEGSTSEIILQEHNSPIQMGPLRVSKEDKEDIKEEKEAKEVEEEKETEISESKDSTSFYSSISTFQQSYSEWNLPSSQTLPKMPQKKNKKEKKEEEEVEWSRKSGGSSRSNGSSNSITDSVLERRRKMYGL